MSKIRSPEIVYDGVTFDNVRAALCATYFFYRGMPQDEWKQALEYVVPMQHNFESPIEPGSQDTWIQFWINEDDRHTQDYNADNMNQTLKSAHITVRFLGVRGETWAKAFHHLTQRQGVPGYFAAYCNAKMLEYISPIVPINVDYFGVGNTTIAFTLSFNLVYIESMDLNWEPLEYILIGSGEMISGGEAA
jgi:hypothetical protein